MFHESRLDLDDAGVAAVGHRIAHGGTVFERPHLVTDDVLEAISQLSELAPLHNPANVCGIEITKKRFPDIPHVAVFDTEFFADLPPSATSIPIDAEVTHKYGIRRYGFHGTSHQYASAQAAQFLARDLAELNTIVLHIGNGASAAAVRGGRAADVTTGMTTVGGLIMGMRPGDVDPGVILHLLRNANMGVDELEDLLNRRSGLKGMCGANDFREINRRRMRATRRPNWPTTSSCRGYADSSGPTWSPSAGSTSSPSPPASAETRPICARTCWQIWSRWE